MKKPTISLVIGDPAGIGPELVAKVLAGEANRLKANIIIIADKNELEKGMSIAKQRFTYRDVNENDLPNYQFEPAIPILIDHKCSHSTPLAYAQAAEQNGVYMLETLKKAVEFTLAGYSQAVCFAPLNKQAMHKGGLQYRDELHWFAELTKFDEFVCELNVVDGIWAGRVTSHIPFKDIVPNLSIQGVVDGIELLNRTLIQAGFDKPKIAVQALNPHGGENGLFGDEELTIIKPAIEIARKNGIELYGPYPADTTMKEVQRLNLNGVLSMYHDQFATALKLLGFERGVTVQGGIPIPIATANHGTAYDMYGKNLATPQAFQVAFDIVVNMANNVLKD